MTTWPCRDWTRQVRGHGGEQVSEAPADVATPSNTRLQLPSTVVSVHGGNSRSFDDAGSGFIMTEHRWRQACLSSISPLERQKVLPASSRSWHPAAHFGWGWQSISQLLLGTCWVCLPACWSNDRNTRGSSSAQGKEAGVPERGDLCEAVRGMKGVDLNI